MRRETISIRGEVYVTLETVARCYEVDVAWIEEVYDHGLLGAGERVEGATAIEAAMLDQVARVLHLHRQLGINLEGIVSMLGGFR